MHAHPSGRLIGKFLLWLIPSFLVVTTFGIFLIMDHAIKRDSDMILARVGNHAGRVVAAIAHHDSTSTPEIAQDMISLLLADRAVQCVALLPAGGDVPRFSAPRSATCTKEAGRPVIELPTEDAEGSRLLVSLDLSEIEEARRDLRNLALLALMLGLLVTIASSAVAFSRTVLAPLNRLLEAILNTHRSGKAVIAAHAPNDELGLVMKNFNRMQENLQARTEAVNSSLHAIRKLYDSTPAPLLAIGEDGTIIEASRFWLAFVGLEREKVIGHPVARFILPGKSLSGRDDAAAGPQDILSAIANAARREDQRMDVCVQHPAGHRIECLLTATAQEGDDKGYLCVLTDITHLRDAERKLRLLANTDRLTGIPNRTAAAELVADMNRALRPDETLVIGYLDLDHFKEINDTLGHEAGDMVLIATTQRIRALLPEKGHVIRLGGDEFALAIPDHAGLDTTNDLAAAILAAIAQPIAIGPNKVKVSGSLGLALMERDETDWATALRHADIAMYAAKRAGKNRFQHYQHAMLEPVQSRSERSELIRDGLENGWFSLALQPIIRLDDLRPVGAEALLRLQKPGQAPASTQAIIETAESTGQIGDIGEWVMQDALAREQDIACISHPDSYLTINLSARQLRPDFLPKLTARLKRTGFPAHRLAVEITETALIENFEEAQALLGAIRALGIRIALDDFGVGYSSLGYLNKLPIDIIKLDRQITACIEPNRAGAGGVKKAVALIRSIAGLADELDISVVAEGIETPDVVEELQSLGIKYGQGYLFARPLPGPIFREWATTFDPVAREARKSPPIRALRA